MSSQTPPPNHDTRAPGIVASAIALMAVSSVAVVLRLWSRYVANSLGLWWDDWSIVATLVGFAALCRYPSMPEQKPVQYQLTMCFSDLLPLVPRIHDILDNSWTREARMDDPKGKGCAE